MDGLIITRYLMICMAIAPLAAFVIALALGLNDAKRRGEERAWEEFLRRNGLEE